MLHSDRQTETETQLKEKRVNENDNELQIVRGRLRVISHFFSFGHVSQKSQKFEFH